MIRANRWTAAALTAAFLLLALLIAGMRVARAEQDAEKPTPTGDKTSAKAADPPGEASKPAHPLRASFDNGNVSVYFLESEMVRKELELTEAQKEKIGPLLQELSERNTKAGADKTDEARMQIVKKIAAILEPRQIDRLLEITAQTKGTTMLVMETEAGKILELTDDQKAKIESIAHEAIKSLSRVDMARYSSETTKEDIKNRTRAVSDKQLSILKEADEKSEKILTPGQLATLRKMKGKELDLKKLRDEGLDYSMSRVQLPPPRTQPPPASGTETRQPPAAGGKRVGQWQMVLDLDVSGLPPKEAVQFAFFDEDPIPAFFAEIKRMPRSLRKEWNQPNSDGLQETVNAAPIELYWDRGFREITGDRVGLLQNGFPKPVGGFYSGAVGKKWVVTKAVTVNGKLVCWCLPIEPKPVDPKALEKASVDLNEKNMIDLRSLFDKAMKEDSTEEEKKATLKSVEEKK